MKKQFGGSRLMVLAQTANGYFPKKNLITLQPPGRDGTHLWLSNKLCSAQQKLQGSLALQCGSIHFSKHRGTNNNSTWNQNFKQEMLASAVFLS